MRLLRDKTGMTQSEHEYSETREIGNLHLQDILGASQVKVGR